MSQAAATAIATNAPSGKASVVLQAQYAHCIVTNAVPPIDQDCWAFSLDPNGVLMPLTTTPATYLLRLVDPTTGKILLNQFGVEPATP